MVRRASILLAFGLLTWGAVLAAAEPPGFTPHTIDPRAGEVCYAVTLADVDGDEKPDIVAVTENRVIWYRNPDWEPRTIIEDQTERDNVCIAAHDIDGDGKVDFALGAGWLNNRNLGSIYWLSRRDSLDETWRVHPIGRESWTHRIQFGDILGTGTPQLVVSPLNKTEGAGVRLLALEVPSGPARDRWTSHVLDDSLNAVHGHWTGDLDGNGRIDVLAASMEGVFRIERTEAGQVVKTKIGSGAPGTPEPQKTGAGEVKIGRLGGRPFVATIEPMHGNQVVVYMPPQEGADAQEWTRHVLDDTLKRGHALWPADLDRDGSDELVVGHSDKGSGDPAGPGVFVYAAIDRKGTRWRKHAVDDGGIATEDLIARDVTGDGWPDIVAGGRATHNVKLYVNQGRGR